MSDPNGAGAGLGTSVASRSMNSMLGLVGARVSYTTSFDWGVLVPNAVVEWNHEFRNDPQTVVVRFLADPTQTPISLTDQAPDSNYFNLGFGLNAVFAQGRSAYVYYQHMTGYSGAHSDQLSLGIRIEF
jgi:outer membrane autotransporter protein